MLYALILVPILWLIYSLLKNTKYNFTLKPKYKNGTCVHPKFLKSKIKVYKVVDYMWNDKHGTYAYHIVNIDDKNDSYPNIYEDELTFYGEDEDETETDSIELP